MKVSYEEGPDGITVVRVAGNGSGGALDAASAPALRSSLLEVIEGGQLILVVDLSAVHHVDKKVLRVLVGARTRVHFQGGTLALVVTSPQARDLLAGVLGEALHTYETVASAVAALAAEYAQRSAVQRRAAIVERASRIERPSSINPLSGLSFEHISEYVTVVKLVGEVDVYSAPALRQLLVDLINHGRVFLVLDMAGVDSWDSCGTGVLIGALKRVRAHDGNLALVVPAERIQKAFRITGMTKVFPVFDTVDPAVEFLGRWVRGDDGW